MNVSVKTLMAAALAFGGACISLLNHADRVKSACLAQLVNAIAPIMTETGGPAWRQTIFYPFKDMSNFGRGTVLQTKVDSPTYDTIYYDPRGTSELRFPIPAVPYLKLSVVHNHDEGSMTIFALNRSLDESLSMKAVVRGFEGLTVKEAYQLRNDDLMAVNTKDAPDTIKPEPLEGVEIWDEQVRAKLAPASWNVIRLEVRKQ